MEKCCNTCGVLSCNQGKKTPEGSPRDWYSQENLDRLWDECRTTGEFLICHSTDPNASRYGGNDKILPGNEAACIGLAFLVFMHIKIFEVLAECDFKRYKKLVGAKLAMEQNAMARAAMDFATGSTGFGTKGSLRGLLLPTVFSEDRPLAYPTGFEKTLELWKNIKELITE